MTWKLTENGHSYNNELLRQGAGYKYAANVVEEGNAGHNGPKYPHN